MLIFFGTRRKVRPLAMLTFVCAICGHRAGQSLMRAVTKFTLFFVPLFPVRSRYLLQCTACGTTSRVTKAQAQQMRG